MQRGGYICKTLRTTNQRKMGLNHVLQSIRKSKSDKETTLKIIKVEPVESFVLKIFFNNLQHRIIDFRPFFNTLEGDYKKYNTPAAFKKVIIRNGELWWGTNADIQLHPIDIYYNSLLHPLHDGLTEDLIVL